MRTKYLPLLFSSLLWAAFSGGDNPVNSQTTSVLKAQPVASPMPEASPRQLNDIFVAEDKLSYNGYDVLRLKKKVKYEYPNESGETKPVRVEVSYAVVKRSARILAKFEGVYFGPGNATGFGLYSLLGGTPKQLIVSQTIPRGGRHWVASLTPDFRLLFDSGDYGVGREEFSVIDVDKDGVSEISLPVTAFYKLQDIMYVAEIPLPEIIFKYDAKAQKYFPANSIFRDYVLRGIEDEIKNLNSNEKSNYLSKRLSILLRYVYAGKEVEGWAVFDREYGLPDKEEMRLKIKAILKDESVYKYINRERAR